MLIIKFWFFRLPTKYSIKPYISSMTTKQTNIHAGVLCQTSKIESGPQLNLWLFDALLVNTYHLNMVDTLKKLMDKLSKVSDNVTLASYLCICPYADHRLWSFQTDEVSKRCQPRTSFRLAIYTRDFRCYAPVRMILSVERNNIVLCRSGLIDNFHQDSASVERAIEQGPHL
ncbi:hypothetical protein ACOME3_009241 [Neoechinorhynchus agilis]